MNLESIEKELKAIKMIIGMFFLLFVFIWADSRASVETWPVNFFGGVRLMVVGVLMYTGSSALEHRVKWPRMQKLVAYLGLATTWIGLALILISAVVSAIYIFA